MDANGRFSENSLIKFVTIVNLGFAVSGFYFAIISRSQSVFFDSIYSFTSSFFMLSALYIIKLVKKGDDKNYQFGYGAFEPLFIIIQTMFILTINFVLAYFAIKTIAGGGSEIETGPALIYTAASSVVCATVFLIVKRAAKKYESPVLAAEAKGWLNDTLLTLAVLYAFLGMIVLRGTKFDFIVPYIDSGMTLIFIIVLVPQFLKLLWINILELLISAPPVDIQKDLNEIIAPFVKKHRLAGFNVYSTKRGRTLYVVAHIYLRHNRTVKTIDRMRKLLIRSIRRYWYYSDIDIIFTLDKTWIDMATVC